MLAALAIFAALAVLIGIAGTLIAIYNRLTEIHVALWRGLHDGGSPYLPEVVQELSRLRERR